MIVDLDELVAKCPDPRSRKYIQESVLCYKAGAYRASIVACWIAVAFDLVDKMRELAAHGDAAAEAQMARFETVRKTNDLSGALAFEKDLPTLARDDFQFVSHVEHMDLARLLEDRNRCAHPSRVSDTEVFEPPAELARLHIVNAIQNILSKDPTQGPAALAKLVEELQGRFFPAREDDVLLFLEASPLRRPRDSLLRSFCRVLVKMLTKGDASSDLRGRASRALFATRRLHPGLWEAEVPALVQSRVAQISADGDFNAALGFLCKAPGLALWGYLREAECLRVKTFVLNMPAAELAVLQDLDAADCPIAAEAIKRLSGASAQELGAVPWFHTPQAAISRMIYLFGRARVVADANEHGRALSLMIMDSKQPQVDLEQVVAAAAANPVLSRSFSLLDILKAFSELRGLGRPAVSTALSKHGVDQPNW